MPTLDPSQYFLPYQVAWLQDQSRLKISEKSRRIGMTYTQAYEDVRDAARANGSMDVWFSSADITAAREYIRYCAQWARILDIGARDLGEIALESERDIRVFCIEFASGKRVNALSSNPDQFRSKGGKVVLDEFAKHEDAERLWQAAQPTMTWGNPLRIISTHMGQRCRYYRMVEAARSPENPWSLHTTTIHDAVRLGLADRVQGRPLTQDERGAWVAELRGICGDEDTWRQEYCCQAIDGATAWLPWELIDAAQYLDAGEPTRYGGGWCYVGMDVGRRRDKTVIWVVETVGDIHWTREVVTLDKAEFEQQLDELSAIARRYRVSRVCIDQQGMGEPVVEAAQKRIGKLRTEGVLLTNPTKQALSTVVKQRMESRKLRIPRDDAIRDSLHAVRREITAAGNYRFDADRTAAGHADEYWALALALHASGDPSPAMEHQAWGDRWSASPDGLGGFASTSPNYRAGNSLFDWS